MRIAVYVQAWAVTLLFGAILSETVLLYPNIFYDVPASLERSMTFMQATGPGDFFPKLGTAVLLVSIISLILCRRHKPAVWYLLASVLVMVVFEFLLSVFYFWPRNLILFKEGSAIHNPDHLRTVASQFQTGHWLRLGASFIASLLACQGLYHISKSRL
jgi:hypothetical protein